MFKRADRFIRELNHQRIDWFRSAKLKLAQTVLPQFGRWVSEDKASAAILVFRLDGKIGDSITATGFLFALKNSFPDYKLILVCGKNTFEIYRGLKCIDTVLILDKGFFQTLKVWIKLANHSFKFLINTSHLLNSQVLFLTNLIKSFRKLTFLNLNDRSFSDHIFYNSETDHVTTRYQKTLAALSTTSVPPLDYHLELVNLSVRKKVESIIDELRLRYPIVIILNSFAGARLRNLNQKITTTIVDQMLKANSKICIISLGNSDDLKIVRTWGKEFSSPRWLTFEESDLIFNLELVRQSDFVITPDTSFVHIASAFKKPLVAIYREDSTLEKNSLIWAPYGTRAEIVYAGHSVETPDDINTVDPKEVVARAIKLLSE